MEVTVTNNNYWALAADSVTIDLYYKDALIGKGQIADGLTIPSRGSHTFVVTAANAGTVGDTLKAVGYHISDCLVNSNKWVLTTDVTVLWGSLSLDIRSDVDVPCSDSAAIGAGHVVTRAAGTKCMLSDAK